MRNQKDLRMHGSSVVDMPGTIHPFPSTNNSFVGNVTGALVQVLQEPQGKRVFGFMTINILVTAMLLIWCVATNSMALTAFTYLTIFDLFYMITSLISLWVQKQKPSAVFSFGYQRFEVLAVFASSILAILGSLFIVKESIERMVVQPDVHTGRLLVGTCVGLVWHLVVTYSVKNSAFQHVIEASASSWLQEHVSDISQSLCHVVPGFSKLLLPRINPFALVGFACSIALVIVHVLIDINAYNGTDTWAAVLIALMTSGTMFPMSVYSGKILLQTTPAHLLGQLDKCLREAATLDGVLEFRNEHFWTLAFGNMCASVHVRVRRDADEQLVLAHVSNRLANLIPILTVHIFKDDWMRPSCSQILGDPSLFPKKAISPTPQSVSSDGSNSYSSVYRPASTIGARPVASPVSSAASTLPTSPWPSNNATNNVTSVGVSRTPAAQLLASNYTQRSPPSLNISLQGTSLAGGFTQPPASTRAELGSNGSKDH